MPHLSLLCMLFLLSFPFSASAAIHVFGDSHSYEFKLIPGCDVHWLGPMTMHRMGRDGLKALDVRQYGVVDGDVCVFCFGEIDARCHIGKQRDVENRPLEEILNTLTLKYLETILLNKSNYSNLHCVVYSLTPPADAVKGFEMPVPYWGSNEDRVMITLILNAKLKACSKRLGIIFLDVYKHYALPNGMIKPELSDGHIHINMEAYAPIQHELTKICQKLNLM